VSAVSPDSSRDRRVAKEGAVLVIMPARNEASRIRPLLVELKDRHPEARLLVVDDASTDATAAVAAEEGAIVVQLPFHLGYGAALQSGYKYAVAHRFEYLVQMDSDGQHLPADVSGLLEHVINDECDLVVGSRFIHEIEGDIEAPARRYEMGTLRSLGRRTLCAFARMGGLQVSDPTSGFQAMNRRTMLLFASDWYPSDYPDVDVLLLAHRRGLRLREHPVNMAPSPRPSTLHSGWLPVYYGYRMMLSLWALSAIPKSDRPDPAESD